MFDRASSIFYVNGQFAGRITTSDLAVVSPQNEVLPDGWIFLSSDTTVLTWEEGITALALAAIFANAIGVSAITLVTFLAPLIENNVTGGTLYVEIHMYTAPMMNPAYRYIWEFTATDGTHIGPYTIHDFN